ncbi:DUF2851 family protein [Formosa sp. A9]|uniref:DUF2851 family protein n=1 Tax=Formosa sp. A9 TaxID=3442641 RepID=UPI003EBAAE75
MQEDFLHYLWKFKKIDIRNLQTVDGLPLELIQVGQHNLNSGPDFFNAQLIIDGQHWAGNVELHVKASDWYVHHHETDTAYDNVILHVVWENDVEVFRKNNTPIPTLKLKPLLPKSTLHNYFKLFTEEKRWINCEQSYHLVDDFVFQNWLERLFFERLEQKSQVIQGLLQTSQSDWEAVLFKMLAKNFGLKVNAEAFLSMASSFDFSVLRKIQNQAQLVEALFYGQSRMLSNLEATDAYTKQLIDDYAFLKQKFQLDHNHVVAVQFFRLRPPNFPTIRLSQLAQLYACHKNLFSVVVNTQSVADYYNLFAVETTAYWNTHYNFQKTSKAVSKKVSRSFIDLVLINTILPIRFSYAKAMGKDNTEELLHLAKALKPESNSIITNFEALKPVAVSALETQGLLQMKDAYCNAKKCLQCAVGNSILSRI